MQNSREAILGREVNCVTHLGYECAENERRISEVSETRFTLLGATFTRTSPHSPLRKNGGKRGVGLDE